MATLTLNIDQAAQMKAKEAFDAEYKLLIAQGVDKNSAINAAKIKGSAVYEQNCNTVF